MTPAEVIAALLLGWAAAGLLVLAAAAAVGILLAIAAWIIGR